jgi:hypothetical protein
MYKLKILKPYGILHTLGEAYFLLKPDPVPGDSWEGDNCYRFVGVPCLELAWEQKGEDGYLVFDYARHIVTTSFTIEYLVSLAPIHFRDLGEVDLSKQKSIKEVSDGKEETLDF